MDKPDSTRLSVRSIGFAANDGPFCRVVLSPKAGSGLKEIHHFSHVHLFFDMGGRPEPRLCRLLTVDEERGRLLLHPPIPFAPAPVFDIKPYFPADDRVSKPGYPGMEDAGEEWFPDYEGEHPPDEPDRWDRPASDGAASSDWPSVGTFRKRGSREVVTLHEGMQATLEEVRGYTHARLLWVFHRFADERYRDTYRVRPPYAGVPLVGVFASRSPVRPNPVAMTTVRVVSLDGERRQIEVRGMDGFDDSPVLGIIPYLPGRERARTFHVPPWAAQWPDWYREEGPCQDGPAKERKESHIAALREIIGDDPAPADDPALFLRRAGKAGKSREQGDAIRITGARQNNLRNLSVTIPKNELTVITGMSGSGKSSLAFDTLYAESQRRFVDTLSTLGRQAFGDVERPDVDDISGLPYAVAIEQKSIGRNARSTVGTVTEIFDFLRLLYSRAARRYCPDCGEGIASVDPEELAETLVRLAAKTDFVVMDRKSGRQLLGAAGHSQPKNKKNGGGAAGFKERVREALAEANHSVRIRLGDGREFVLSSHPLCPQCDRVFFQMTSSYFSFNHPDGMCPECRGLGRLLDVDPGKIVPRPDLSLLDGASPWWGNLRAAVKNPTMNWMRMETLALALHLGEDLERPWQDLSEEFRSKALFGTEGEKLSYRYHSKGTGRSGVTERPVFGAVNHIRRLVEDGSSEAVQPAWLRFMSEKECPLCRGERLSAEGRTAVLAGLRYPEAARKSIGAMVEWIEGLPAYLDHRAFSLAGSLLPEIRRRCLLLAEAGLAYLSLDRPSSTLSGGEAQRIRLAGQLGCGLNNLLYVLDEPSMGLHARDHERMLRTIRGLRDEGNTVVVVEHDPDTIAAADHIIDMGPGAGCYGGEIVASGSAGEIAAHPDSLTGAYLSGRKTVLPAGYRREFRPYGHLVVTEALKNNLKSLSVSIPLGAIVAVTGVSGSGKSTLVHQVLCPSVRELLEDPSRSPQFCRSIDGIEGIDKIIMVDQSPIGRTPRSNPASYTGLWDGVRALFASTPEAKRRGYGPNCFSFNNKEGACPACQGDGRMRTEMHFMPDVWSTCPQCQGRRFRPETLEVQWNGMTVADVLAMEIAAAEPLFPSHRRVHRVLKTLADVGLGYLKLGQSALDLSGGEAQRVKLARELCRPDTGRTLYVLDEPTTGLHFEDIRHLLDLLYRLKKGGNTILLVEHNLDLIGAADYVIDLGPEGGEEGGCVVVQGTVQEVMDTPESHTGRHLKRHLAGHPGASRRHGHPGEDPSPGR